MIDDAKTKAWEKLCEETGLVDLTGDLQRVHSLSWDAALKHAEKEMESLKNELFLLSQAIETDVPFRNIEDQIDLHMRRLRGEK